MTLIEMVERFQCPGCVCGCDTECGRFKPDEDNQKCESHVIGTMVGLGNSVAIGLPKGFCKAGLDRSGGQLRARTVMDLRLWPAGSRPEWDHLNVPVWALEKDGCLFVRTFAPRVNLTWVDVIEGGTLSMVPNAINVQEFYDRID